MGKRRSEEEDLSVPESKKTKIPSSRSKQGPSENSCELLVDPEKPWYLVKIKESWEITGPRPGAAAELAEITKKASEAYEQQMALYDQQREMSKSDREWLKTVMASGTTSDKCSTFQVQIAEAPLYGAQYIVKLMELARSTSRHESVQAIQALEKVFNTVLPPVGVRKLHYLKQRKWAKAISQISAKTLVVLHFEELVKKAFFEYLKLVEIMVQDQISHNRELALRILCHLGSKHDEQQSNICALLANKLGDTDRKLASRALYYLQEIINAQKEATIPVITQVEQLIQRPGISEKAQYYALTFLSQVMLSHDQPAIAERLVKIYLGILKSSVIPSIIREAEKAKNAKRKKRLGHRHGPAKKKGEASTETELAHGTSRMAKVVTTGLNRALPYYKGTLHLMAELADPIRRLIASGSFATSMQALSLLFQVASTDKTAGLSADFVKTVESVLIKPEVLVESSAHPQLLALLYKVMVSQDLSAKHTEALVKALLGLAIRVPSLAFTMSVLLLVGELFIIKPALFAMINIPSDSIDPADACLWALQVFEQHYDSKVRLLASSIIQGRPAMDALDSENPFEVCIPSQFLQSCLR
jgi:ribosome biogenesis protein MAK21